MGQIITVESKGSLERAIAKLRRLSGNRILSIMQGYGVQGVSALSSATPTDSGETADSWYYKIEASGNVYTISWHNRHIVEGVNIAIILQYGHGTGTGGYVQGRDYINPAIRPIFDRIRADVVREVTSA